MIEVYKIVHGYHDPECVPYLQPNLYQDQKPQEAFKLNILTWNCEDTI